MWLYGQCYINLAPVAAVNKRRKHCIGLIYRVLRVAHDKVYFDANGTNMFRFLMMRSGTNMIRFTMMKCGTNMVRFIIMPSGTNNVWCIVMPSGTNMVRFIMMASGSNVVKFIMIPSRTTVGSWDSFCVHCSWWWILSNSVSRDIMILIIKSWCICFYQIFLSYIY